MPCRELGADPLLARARDRQAQRALVVGVAVLLAQALAGLLAQASQHLGVIGQLADARRAGSLSAISCSTENCVPGRSPLRGK